ncbi:GNAT family N-acetyltransferase [Planctomycetota bacterium]
MSNWKIERPNWSEAISSLCELYNTTWKGHPITQPDFFKWQIMSSPYGQAIGSVAVPNGPYFAGVYLVLPVNLIVNGNVLPFSVSVYTMTHPKHYKQGIFVKLANDTYTACSERKIFGTVGVPNNNSLPGFVRKLNFAAFGQFNVLYKVSRPFLFKKHSSLDCIAFGVDDLKKIQFNQQAISRHAKLVFMEKSCKLLKWRYFDNPAHDYNVHACIAGDVVLGFVVFRKAYKKKIPIVVIMDICVDLNKPNNYEVYSELLRSVNNFALKSLCAFIIIQTTPGSTLEDILRSFKFGPISKSLLPHESNFIIKTHLPFTGDGSPINAKFSDWYFSFGDYDLF